MHTAHRRLLAALPLALVLAALAGSPPSFAATPSQPEAHALPSPTTQGIIMRDGGICNPRWGC